MNTFNKLLDTAEQIMRQYRHAILLIAVVFTMSMINMYTTGFAYSRGFDAGYDEGYAVAQEIGLHEAKEETRIHRIQITNYLQHEYKVDAQEAYRLADYFLETAAEFGLDAKLLVAQSWAESRFVNGAVSPDGAVGLMQIMPKYWATGQIFFVKSIADLRNPRINIRAGGYVMRHYMDIASRLNVANLRESTLHGYHGGERGMKKPMKETKDYVKAIQTKYDLI